MNEMKKFNNRTMLIFIIMVLASMLFGIIITRSASAYEWNSSLETNLTAYYNMNDTGSGYFWDSLGIHNMTLGAHPNNDFVAGLFEDGYSPDALGYTNTTLDFSDFTELTLNFWMYRNSTTWATHWLFEATDGPNAINDGEIMMYGAPDEGLRFEWAGSTSTGSTTFAFPGLNEWAMITILINSTNVTTFINGTASTNHSAYAFSFGSEQLHFFGRQGSSSNWSGSWIDEIGIWNRTLTTNEITQLFNDGAGITYGIPEVLAVNVELYHPLDNAQTAESIINFSANYTAVKGNLTNTTLMVWYPNGTLFKTNSTDINGTSNSTTLYISNFSAMSGYKWNYYACAHNVTTNLCGIDSANFTISITASVDAEYYLSEVYETSSQLIQANISTPAGSTLHSASLIYNGTTYAATATTITTAKFKVERTIDSSIADDGVTKNFYWRFAYTEPDGTITYQNSSIRTQDLVRIYLANCNSTHSNITINFTIKDEKNPNPHLNASLYSAWKFWLGSGGVKKNMSYENISESVENFGFCINPSNMTYYMDTDIELEKTLWSPNYHYFRNASFNNITTDVSLYLINSSLATLTELIVYDRYQNELNEVIIQIQKYDIGTDTYYTIGMAKTSSQGNDLVYLKWYNTFYKFTLVRYGAVVKITDIMKIAATPVKFIVVPDVTFHYDKFSGVTFILYYNNATSNFVLTFADPTGSISSGCLRVIKRFSTNDTVLCNTCESSTSATLYCHINGTSPGTYIASFLATGSDPYHYGSISIKIRQTLKDIFSQLGNLDATILAVALAGSIAFLFLVSPILGIIGILIGLLASSALGFTTIDYISFIGLSLIGGFIIWQIKQ